MLCYSIYKNNKYHISECKDIKEDLSSLIGCDEIEVSFRPQKNEVYIKMNYAGTEKSVQFLKKMADYMDNSVDDVNFIINELKCKYVILMDIGYTMPGPRVVISNYYENMSNDEYNNKGIYMEIMANYDEERYNGVQFENVRYLWADGDLWSGWGLKDLTFAEHFPNLEYLDMCMRETTAEELEYLKSVLPEECVIDHYISAY